jgi:acyl transferase domain-containing protein
MLSPEGRCKTLDAAADGYVRAEAAGIMLLQHVSVAQQGMQLLAVLAGSAVNQDGRSSSLTAPNGPAQQEVLRAALADRGLTPADLTGISMHGTGTPLGELNGGSHCCLGVRIDGACNMLACILQKPTCCAVVFPECGMH